MDSLKALVAEKRKAIQDDSARPTKYMRKGDLERIKEDQETKIREEKRIAEEASKREEEAKQAAKKVSSLPCAPRHFLPDVSLEDRPHKHQAHLVIQRPQTQSLPSISLTKKLSDVCVPKANRFGFLANQTRIVV